MEDRVSKEVKLMVVKDIVSSFVRGAAASGNLNNEQVCSLFKDLYDTVDKAFPEPPKRTVGLN